MVSLAEHKFVELMEVNSDISELKDTDTSKESFNYMLEVYMDDYIVLNIPKIQDQLHHVANEIMTDINDVFPPYKDDESFQLQMGFSYPFLHANDLCSFLLNIRARSFVLCCT